jgi:hypothetical protein
LAVALRKDQRGLSTLSWLVVIGIAVFFGMVGIKSFPVYMNHYKVVSILANVAAQPTIGEQTPNDIARTLEKRFDIDMVKHVTHKDVKVVSLKGSARELALIYEVRVHMFYNVDAVYSFEEHVPLKN